jgi:hypothetical protein
VIALAAIPACEDPPVPVETLAATPLRPGRLEHDVPISTAVAVRFSVPLDPAVVGPDALRLRSGSLVPSGTVHYGLVDRTLTFLPSAVLRTRMAYEAVLGDAVRGIDGSVPSGPLDLTFVTGELDAGRESPPPPASFDEAVRGILAPRCATCHGGSRPVAALELWPPERVAELPRAASRQWVGWSILAPGRPERSYLMYKITGCPGLVGGRMPPGRPLDDPDARVVERWVAAGARTSP